MRKLRLDVETVIDGRRVTAIIPARGGSKGLPGKNSRLLLGKPLIAHTIECATLAPSVDRVIVSSDSPAILTIAETCGAEAHHRPAELASDTSLVIDTLRHVLGSMHEPPRSSDYFVLLQPTSPLRRVDDVEACVRLAASGSYDTAATFVEAATHPSRVFTLSNSTAQQYLPGADLWSPRQAFEPVFELNGAVYVTPTHGLHDGRTSVLFGRIGAVVMPKSRSIDIDDEHDFMLAEAILNQSVPQVR